MTPKLNYANPKVYRSRFWMWVPRPTLPAKVTKTCAVLSLSLLLPALVMMHDYKFIRDYNPHWWQWVTPSALPLAFLFSAIATVPSKDGFQRSTRILAFIGLACSTMTGAWAVLMPGGVACGERADRIMCASNLRQIGQALQIYASAHAGAFPDNLEDLPATVDISRECLVCPMADDTTHVSYTYLGTGSSWPLPASDVLAYEASSNHGGTINVLYGDGHIEGWQTLSALQQYMVGLKLKPTTGPATTSTIPRNPATSLGGRVR